MQVYKDTRRKISFDSSPKDFMIISGGHRLAYFKFHMEIACMIVHSDCVLKYGLIVAHPPISLMFQKITFPSFDVCSNYKIIDV